jgi:hypothetical protein
VMDSSQAVLDQFVERGGTVFVLEGAELERIRSMEAESIYPSISDLLSADVLEAAVAYTSQ